MSQSEPRRAVDGSGHESPITSSGPTPLNGNAIRHPLPQHPHTHIPAHLRGSSHRGGRHTSKPSTPTVQESPEIKALRQKYGAKLTTLQEIYSTWSDEDLLTLLGEVNGNVDTAAERIAEGRVAQWGSVPNKKDKKDKDRATPSSFSGSGGHHIPPRDGAASPGRGSFRGGRGGGFAGARGGRGGSRLGGGSGPDSGSAGTPSNGAWAKGAPNTGTKSDSATIAPTWDTEANADQTGWGSAASGDLVSVAPTIASGAEPDSKAAKPSQSSSSPRVAAVAPAQQKSTIPSKPPAKAPLGPPKMSWAQIAKPKQAPVPTIPTPAPAPALAPVPAPVPAPPTPPAVIPIVEPSQPDAVAEPPSEPSESAAKTSEQDQLHESTEAAKEPSQEVTDSTISWPSHEEEAQTAPQDDWIAVTPPTQAAVELPPAIEMVKEEEKPMDEPTTTLPAAPPPATKEETVAPAATTQVPPLTHPPGLPAIPSSVPTPSLSTISSAAAPTSAAKPVTPRMAHRASAKYKISDAPVVMPGGGIPSTSGIGPWSFGNLAPASDAVLPVGGAGRFGMQFGSLSLDDDEGINGTDKPPTPEPVQEPAEPEPVVQVAPQPPVHKEPTPAPVVATQVDPKPEVIPSPSPNFAQQAQQQQPQHSVDQPQHRSAPNGTTLSAINTLFQQAQQQQQQPQPPAQIQTQAQHLPHQVTSAAAPSPVSSLPSFGGAPGLQHLQQPQSNLQPVQHQPSLQSHLSHLHNQSVQLGTGQQTQGLTGVGVGGAQQAPAQPHPPYSNSPHQSQLPAHLAGVATEQQHPAIAAQNAYFRGAQDVVAATTPYGGFHAPTPPHQQTQLDHTGMYGGFSALGAGGQIGSQQQQQASQTSHLGGSGFGSSPAAGDYGGYDAQSRGFYDSYGQGSGFQSRNQLGGLEDPTKSSHPPSNLSNTLPGQQASQGQTGGQSAGQQAGQFGMMPYYHYQQPYFHPLPTHQYNPYGNPQNPYSKYVPPYTQPPSLPGGPPPPQQTGTKPPVAAAASPYGGQSHLHYPNQNSPYDDPSTGTSSYQTGTGADFGKQQQQALYGGQGLGTFYGGNQGVPSTQQNGGGQLGGGAGGAGAGVQTQRAGSGVGGSSTSPENPYKPYNGPGVGVGGAGDKAGLQQGQQGRGTGVGGAQGASSATQPQQGRYYPNQYSNQAQPATQGYPQSDGQFYPSYQQQRQYWS
ncbi:hypothetical protein FRB93_009573 [Tulasnella sp. JGI-2019a]|nr:hypothetical protein FRB93_009573 [Tulasnella sp. JGI-2019a]